MAGETNPSPVLLFDVMGTLVHDPFFVEIPEFFGLSLSELIRTKHPSTWVEFELGRIDEAELGRRFFMDCRAFDLDGLRVAMARAYRWLEGMEVLVERLHARGFTMHALSNYAPWYRLIEQKLALSRFVQWSFVSCDTGVRKPHHDAYRGAAAALGIDPSGCVFIDDRQQNCVAAREVGMRTILFAGATSLHSELAALRIV